MVGAKVKRFIGIIQAKYDNDVDLGVSSEYGDKGTDLASLLELEQQELISLFAYWRQS